MLARIASLILVLLAMIVLISGLLSLRPDEEYHTVWVEPETSTPNLQMAMIHGVFHVVLTTSTEHDAAHEKQVGPDWVYYRCVALHARVVRGIGIPFWMVCVLCMTWPLTWLVHGPLRRRHRRRHHRCIDCGYDLSSMQAAQCPECGQSTRTTSDA